MSALALDTSVAVPLLVRNHAAHVHVSAWAAGRTLVLAGHALAETYSVLTRLPALARVAPLDAARLLEDRFVDPLVLGRQAATDLVSTLSGLGIAGGAVYDALIGLTAAEHDATLATRDARARSTYELVGARTLLV